MQKPRKYKRNLVAKHVDCIYCDGLGIPFNSGQPKFKLRLINNFNDDLSLNVTFDNFYNLITSINYCPVCGRRLIENASI